MYIFLSLYMYAIGDNTFTLYITELIPYFAILLILLCGFCKILLDLPFVTNAFHSILVLHFIFYMICTSISNWLLFVKFTCVLPTLSLICNNIHVVLGSNSSFVWSINIFLKNCFFSFIVLELPNVLSFFLVMSL